MISEVVDLMSVASVRGGASLSGIVGDRRAHVGGHELLRTGCSCDLRCSRECLSPELARVASDRHRRHGDRHRFASRTRGQVFLSPLASRASFKSMVGNSLVRGSWDRACAPGRAAPRVGLRTSRRRPGPSAGPQRVPSATRTCPVTKRARSLWHLLRRKRRHQARRPSERAVTVDDAAASQRVVVYEWLQRHLHV